MVVIVGQHALRDRMRAQRLAHKALSNTFVVDAIIQLRGVCWSRVNELQSSIREALQPESAGGCRVNCDVPANHSSACVPCVIAPPARSAAATIVVSTSSCSVAPAFLAFFEWISMQ